MPRIAKVNQLKKFRTDSFNYEKEDPKPKIEYFWYPKYVEQLISLKLTPERSLQDASLNNFMSSVSDPKNFTKEIVHMIRLKSLDRLSKSKSHEKKEYLVTYENWTGYDKNNRKIASVSDYPAGTLDRQVIVSKEYSQDGTSYHKVQEEYNVYTLEYSPEAVDQALESCPDTQLENVQFSVAGLRSWGGFNYDEFRNLSYEELCERGRTGQVGFPVDSEILEKQRELSELREKKRKERSERKGSKK